MDWASKDTSNCLAAQPAIFRRFKQHPDHVVISTNFKLNIMDTTDNKLPLDDSMGQDYDEQSSQQDVHSNGLSDEFVLNQLKAEDEDDDGIQMPESDLLEQASDSSEPSFTLDPDKGIAPKQSDEDTNVKS